MCHPRQEFSLKFAILLEINFSSYMTALGVQLPSMWSPTTYRPRSYILPDRQPWAGISPENACYRQWASQQPTILHISQVTRRPGTGNFMWILPLLILLL